MSEPNLSDPTTERTEKLPWYGHPDVLEQHAERAPEVDFGLELADPRDVLDGLLCVYGVEHTAVCFAEAVTRHRQILNEAAEVQS